MAKSLRFRLILLIVPFMEGGEWLFADEAGSAVVANSSTKLRLISALSRCDPALRGARESLLLYSEDSDLTVRAAAITALGLIYSEYSVEKLSGVVIDTEIQQILLQMMQRFEKDDSLLVKRCILRAVGNIGKQAGGVALDKLKKVLIDSRVTSLHTYAADAIALVDKKCTALILTVEGVASISSKKAALRAILNSRIPEARQLAIRCMRADDESLRITAIHGVGITFDSPEEIVRILKPFLTDRSERVSSAARQALSAAQDAESLRRQ